MRLGVTGGIGCGKSFVCRLLERDFGVPVYDCDSRARGLMLSSPVIRQGLTRLLGEGVYLSDGALNKPLLADFLFASREGAQAVNGIVHPVVKADFLRWADEKAHCPLVLMESAILFESGFRDVVDAVLLVEAPLGVRLARVQERDGLTEAQVRARMRSQMPDEERRRLADFTLCNDGTADLHPVLKRLLNRL